MIIANLRPESLFAFKFRKLKFGHAPPTAQLEGKVPASMDLIVYFHIHVNAASLAVIVGTTCTAPNHL